jgi:predicted signal transduction protein with EAL and GGDEF domain
VSAAIAFAKALDLAVVAEGIENRDQLELLRQLGCTTGQGYLFSPAVPPEELETMLRERGTSMLGADAAAMERPSARGHGRSSDRRRATPVGRAASRLS